MSILKQAKLIFLVSIILALVVTFALSYQNRVDTIEAFDRQQQAMKEAEWRYIWGKVEALRLQARDKAESLAAQIRHEILTEYKTNGRDLSKDLGDLDQDNHPIVNILAKIIPGVYLNGFISDSDDPFVATKKGIASDFSIDCSAEGRSRSFEKEIDLHYSKVLASDAIEKIKRQDHSLIGWQFTKPSKPEYTFGEFSEKNLYRLFDRYGTDALHSFEFLVAVYIDEKEDLAGVPVVDARGLKGGGNQIIVVQGFNIMKQLAASADGSATLTWYGEKFKSFENDETWIVGIYDSLLIFVSALIVFVYLTGMSQIERSRNEVQGNGSGKSTG